MPILFNVDATTSFIISSMAGCPVDLVLYDEGRTRLIKTEVETPIPLRLKMLDPDCLGVRAARRVMLLAHHQGLAMRADGHLDQTRIDEHGAHLDISSVHWELLERRRHIRVPVTVPVSLRIVVDGESEPELDVIHGTTLDMSISGAFVKTADLPPEGSLVEFAVSLNGEEIRTLAVVAHVALERSGVGLHFVEYLENARYLLHGFLSRAA